MTIGATYTFPPLAHEWLKHELDFEFTRKAITLASGAGNLRTGTVLGRIVSGTASSAAKAGGNTGTGTFVLDETTPVVAGAVSGVYQLRCIAAASNSGTFRLFHPNGSVLGDFTITGGAGGTVTVNKHIKGVLTDADPDFAVGDGFDVVVTVGEGKYVKYNPTLTNGAGIAAAILLNAADATSADVRVAGVVGKAVINPLSLIWDASVDSSAKKAAALADLANLGISTRAIV
ncbi:head decoration protein [Leptospira interrogans]